jgi:hypothetical protein
MKVDHVQGSVNASTSASIWSAPGSPAAAGENALADGVRYPTISPPLQLGKRIIFACIVIGRVGWAVLIVVCRPNGSM